MNDETRIGDRRDDQDGIWLLDWSCTGLFRDQVDAERPHSPFIMNRRVVVLSIPEDLDLNAPTTAARDVLEVVQDAMERPTK